MKETIVSFLLLVVIALIVTMAIGILGVGSNDVVETPRSPNISPCVIRQCDGYKLSVCQPASGPASIEISWDNGDAQTFRDPNPGYWVGLCEKGKQEK